MGKGRMMLSQLPMRVDKTITPADSSAGVRMLQAADAVEERPQADARDLSQAYHSGNPSPETADT